MTSWEILHRSYIDRTVMYCNTHPLQLAGNLQHVCVVITGVQVGDVGWSCLHQVLGIGWYSGSDVSQKGSQAGFSLCV
jgi:hypothetical protein